MDNKDLKLTDDERIKVIGVQSSINMAELELENAILKVELAKQKVSSAKTMMRSLLLAIERRLNIDIASWSIDPIDNIFTPAALTPKQKPASDLVLKLESETPTNSATQQVNLPASDPVRLKKEE